MVGKLFNQLMVCVVAPLEFQLANYGIINKGTLTVSQSFVIHLLYAPVLDLK